MSVLDNFVEGLQRMMVGSGSRINRANMPNGFFFGGLLWHGDEASRKTIVSKGFLLEPEDISDAGDDYLNALWDGQRRFLRATQDYQIQFQYTTDSDYSDELDRYDRRTAELRDHPHAKWNRRVRVERSTRYRLKQAAGLLRREKLALFVTREIETDYRRVHGQEELTRFFQDICQSEEKAIREGITNALINSFPTCRVKAMDDEANFLYYYNFLNPNTIAQRKEHKLAAFDPTLSVQQNCLLSSGNSPSNVPGVSFNLDCHNHALFVVKQWPGVSVPGIVRALTGLDFLEYSITANIYPQKLEKAIAEQEKVVNRLKMDVQTENRQSLVTQLREAAEKVDDLESNRVLPYKCLYVIRLWHKNADGLAARCATLKNALSKMGGTLAYHVTNPETARQIFYQTWPGWTAGAYRHYDLYAEDDYLCHMLPFSATFTGHLEQAEAIYDGKYGNLMGVTTEIGGTVQHAAFFGQTGSGKSVIMTDLLSQIGAFYDFQLIVEEGMSYGVYTRAVGSHPIVIQQNSEETINYLDTNGTPLTPLHFSLASALCLQMMGEGSDRERMAIRQSILVEAMQQLYSDWYQDWRFENEDQARDIDRRACAMRRFYKERMRGGDRTLLDAFVEIREWEDRDPEAVREYLDSISEEDIVRFGSDPDTAKAGRDLAFAYFRPERFPIHSALVDALRYDKIGSVETRTERQKMGRLLQAWSRDGQYGRLFDGKSSIQLNGHVAHFELGEIPEQATELKAAAYFLVANRGRQEIITRPRGQRKAAIFEEASRIVALPSGESFVTNFYNQLRKYNCFAVSLFQQYAALNTPAVRSAVIGNSKMFFVTAQRYKEAINAIGEAIGLSSAAVETIRGYTPPEHMAPSDRYAAFSYIADDTTRRICGTAHNYVCSPVLYASKSDGDLFDRRKRELAKYADPVDGIWAESEHMNRTEQAKPRPQTIPAEIIHEETHNHNGADVPDSRHHNGVQHYATAGNGDGAGTRLPSTD
jgi:hypothetical protein